MKYLDMRTVQARFEGSQNLYSYFVPAGDEPKVGDYLVTSCTWDADLGGDDVDAGQPRQHAHKALSTARVAKVVKIEPTPNAKATRFYLKLLSVAEIAANGEANKEMLLKVKARADAKAKLDKMLAERNVIEQYRQLAAADPEAAALLAELEG